MNLRDALVQQNPSLALQRAAADEISSLDAQISSLDARLAELRSLLDFTLTQMHKSAEVFWKKNSKLLDLEAYLEAHDLTKEFEEWLKRNTEE